MREIQEQLNRIEDKLDNFTDRLARVETNQSNARTFVGWIAGIVAALVATAITWVVSAISSKVP